MSDELKMIPFNLPVLLLRSPFPKTEAMARLAQACGECGVEVQMIRKDGTVTIVRAGQPVLRVYPDGAEPPVDTTRH
jgi:hypothetical protein